MLALKNSRRSPRQYRTIVLSLSVSVVLFLTTSFGLQSIIRQYRLENDLPGSDMTVWLQLKDSAGKQQDDIIEKGDVSGMLALNEAASAEETLLLDRIAQVQGVTEKAVIGTNFFETLIAPEQFSAQYRSYLQGSGWNREEHNGQPDGRCLMEFMIVGMDDASFSGLCAQAGTAPDSCGDAASPAGILINRSHFKSFPQHRDAYRVEVPVLNVKVGDTLPIGYFSDYPERSDPVDLGGMRIAAVINEPIEIMGVPRPEERQLVAVVPQKTLSRLIVQGGTTLFCGRELNLRAADMQALHTRIEQMNLGGTGATYFQTVLSQDNKTQREKETGMFLTAKVFAGGFIALISAIGIANIFNTVSTGVMLRRREYAMLQSAGMTPGSFHRMLRLESFWYGFKALLYGIPISFATMFLLHFVIQRAIRTTFSVPWLSLLCAVCAVFLVTGLTMIYAGRQVKKGALIDAVREESI